jgi:hypothetical protein
MIAFCAISGDVIAGAKGLRFVNRFGFHFHGINFLLHLNNGTVKMSRGSLYR